VFTLQRLRSENLRSCFSYHFIFSWKLRIAAHCCN